MEDLGVTTDGNALVTVVKVVVVPGETDRDALQDAGGKLVGRSLPLLGRVTVDERLVDLATDLCERPLLHVARVGKLLSVLLGLISELEFRVSRRGDTPQLVQRHQVDGKRQ